MHSWRNGVELSASLSDLESPGSFFPLTSTGYRPPGRCVSTYTIRIEHTKIMVSVLEFVNNIKINCSIKSCVQRRAGTSTEKKQYISQLSLTSHFADTRWCNKYRSAVVSLAGRVPHFFCCYRNHPMPFTYPYQACITAEVARAYDGGCHAISGFNSLASLRLKPHAFYLYGVHRRLNR